MKTYNHRRKFGIYGSRDLDGVLPFEVPSSRTIYVGQKCAYCDNKITHQNFTKDHVIPKSSEHFPKLEITQRLNIVPACFTCNQAKRNVSFLEYMRSIGEIKFGGAGSRLR